MRTATLSANICSVFAAVLCTTLLLGTTIASQPAEDRSVSYDLDIPSQNLNDALQAFAIASQHKLLYSSALVDGMRSPALKGQFTTEQAVKQLLSGTHLDYEITSDGLVLIRGEDQAARSGAAPATSGQNQTGADPSAQEGEKNSSGQFRVAQVDQGKSSSGVSVANGASSTKGDVNGPSEGLAEIIVTAQKRSERLQDVPVPVTVISGQTLVDTNQLRLEDYYASVPGLNFVPGYGGFASISIRGLTTGSANNPTVGIVVDDVPYGSSTANGGGFLTPDIDPSDLARVEVLRGPQGTLYGASSLGGLIKYVTIDPSTDGLSGYIQGGVSSVYNGNEPGFSERASINVPIGDTIAIRVSAFGRRDPGYIDAPYFTFNPTHQEDGVNVGDTNGGRLAVLWKPQEDFSVKLSAVFQNNRVEGTADSNLLPGLGDLQQIALQGTGAHNTKSQIYSVTVKAKLGIADITSVSSFGSNSFLDTMDYTSIFNPYLSYLSPPLIGNFGVPGYEDRSTNKLTQEIRSSISIGPRLTWLIGGFFTHEDSEALQNVYVTDPVTLVPVEKLYRDDEHTTYEEYALFTDLTWAITDRFDVQFGGRESENRQTYTETIAGPYAAAFLSADPTVVPQFGTEDKSFTYLITPRLKITPDLMMYARFASGYRPGGPNNLPVEGTPLTFGPDTTRNYEIGVKGDALSHTLSFDASLYYIDWKNIQIGVFNPDIGASYTLNAGAAKSQGIELSAEYRSYFGLTVSGWVAWNDAELVDNFPAISESFGAKGSPLPFSSRFSGDFSIQQDFPLTSQATAFVGGDIRYVGDRAGDFTANQSPGPQLPRPNFSPYAQTNFRAGTKYDSWTLNLYMNNALDRRGVLQNDLLSSGAVIYIQPRTLGLLVGKQF